MPLWTTCCISLSAAALWRSLRRDEPVRPSRGRRRPPTSAATAPITPASAIQAAAHNILSELGMTAPTDDLVPRRRPGMDPERLLTGLLPPGGSDRSSLGSAAHHRPKSSWPRPAAAEGILGEGRAPTLPAQVIARGLTLPQVIRRRPHVANGLAGSPARIRPRTRPDRRYAACDGPTGGRPARRAAGCRGSAA
jgi:hypothetical protein